MPRAARAPFAPADADFLFDRDPETKWEEALARVKVDL